MSRWLARAGVSAAVAWLVAGAAAPVVGDELSQRVLVVYNQREPASLPLARYYAERRGIPGERLCAIDVRAAETITRAEFENDIRAPIMKFLRDRKLITQLKGQRVDPVIGAVPVLETIGNEIHYIVLLHGVPLRIENDPQRREAHAEERLPKHFHDNNASVESELALLPTSGAPLTGFVPNPFLGRAEPFGPPWSDNLILVGRLDGPDPATVRRLIDDAIAVERFGLHGRGYFDARSITEGGYKVGDDWIRAAAELFQKLGYETDLDVRPQTYGPEDRLADAALYAGWYTTHADGPFKREDFQFRRGAIAVHIHSASGASVRSRTAYWVGPLLDRGAAATLGNVYEPFLQLTPRLDQFFARLTTGATFLEAAYASQPVLSWQTTFVGDPLYRPFKLSVDDQLKALAAAAHPDLEWAWLRKINLLAQAGERAEAIALCRKQAAALESSRLAAKLAWLLDQPSSR